MRVVVFSSAPHVELQLLRRVFSVARLQLPASVFVFLLLLRLFPEPSFLQLFWLTLFQAAAFSSLLLCVFSLLNPLSFSLEGVFSRLLEPLI